MASRTPSRSGRSSRSSTPTSNPAPMVFGGIGVVVVAGLLIFMNSGDSQAATPAAKPATPASAPAADAGKSTPQPVPLGSAKSGKTPAKPAPALTQDTLQQARDLLQQAKTLNNEGVTARSAGKNEEARSKQSAAKDKIDALKALIEAPLRWQEEAEFGGWSQPTEYVALEKLYAEVSTVENRIRKGGGT